MKSPNVPTEQANKSKRLPFLILVVCLVLVMDISLTMALLGDRLRSVAPDDSGVINLVTPTQPPEADTGTGRSEDDQTTETTGDPTETATTATAATTPVYHPSFSAEDAKQVWATETQIEIFKVSHDETGTVTVQSLDGDKVFAPGTTHSYAVTFKNNGDVALDYQMSITAYLNTQELTLPVQARMNRYDGTWLVGSEAEWVPALTLDGVTDEATLGVNNYACYNLDWQWPYETADENGDVSAGDAYDTWLGNLAIQEDITLTVEIRVMATISNDPGSGGGLDRPDTGDHSHMRLYAVLMAVSGVLLILLLVFYFRKRKTDDETEKD